MSTVVPFNSGVVRKLPEIKEPKGVDKLRCIDLDRNRFADYQIILLAASKGDVKKCQEVINRGFRDFDAKSNRRYGIEGNEKFCGLSPREVAKERSEILELFDRYSFKVPTQLSKKNSSFLKQDKVDHLTEKEKQAYDKHMKFIKGLSQKDFFDKKAAALNALIESYPYEEMMEKMEQFQGLEFPQLLALVRNRIGQPFAEEKKLERARLIALRDFLDTFVSKA